MPSRLPPLPSTTIVVLEDRSTNARCDVGFIRLRRQSLAARYPDGTLSQPFDYDDALRSALDAVVVVPHYVDAAGDTCVYLRSALRPPVALRAREVWPLPERETLGQLWEVPAGLVEHDERSEPGLRRCAARELAEELGFTLTAEDMLPLGPSTFPAPALIGERHFYFHCAVDPSSRTAPRGDGSPLEDHAAIVALPLTDALALVRCGEIEDAKTEIALRRLAEFAP